MYAEKIREHGAVVAVVQHAACKLAHKEAPEIIEKIICAMIIICDNFGCIILSYFWGPLIN